MRLAVLAGDVAGGGAEALRTLELAVRDAMIGLGGALLERLLAADRGHRGTRVDCGHDHEAVFVGYRAKHLDTVLGPVVVRRGWYHCADCGTGHAPRDVELGVAGASLSPGLRRMVARVGSAEPFAQACRDLAELAGVELSVKRVERSAEADGRNLQAVIVAEADAILAGTLSPLGPSGPVATLYVAMHPWTARACRACPSRPTIVAASTPTGAPAPAK